MYNFNFVTYSFDVRNSKFKIWSNLTQFMTQILTFQNCVKIKQHFMKLKIFQNTNSLTFQCSKHKFWLFKNCKNQNSDNFANSQTKFLPLLLRNDLFAFQTIWSKTENFQFLLNNTHPNSNFTEFYSHLCDITVCFFKFT